MHILDLGYSLFMLGKEQIKAPGQATLKKEVTSGGFLDFYPERFEEKRAADKILAIPPKPILNWKSPCRNCSGCVYKEKRKSNNEV